MKFSARDQKLRSLASQHVDEEVLAAGIFGRNAGFYGGGAILGLFTFIAEERADWRGALAPESLWVLTPGHLYIFGIRIKVLSSEITVKELIGKWPRDEIKAYRVPEKNSIPGDPSFAVAFEDPHGNRVEMAAFIHSKAEFELIEMLTSGPNNISLQNEDTAVVRTTLHDFTTVTTYSAFILILVVAGELSSWVTTAAIGSLAVQGVLLAMTIKAHDDKRRRRLWLSHVYSIPLFAALLLIFR